MNVTLARKAIVAALSGDATLSSLLATKKDNISPAIFIDNQFPPPVYPCLIYSLPDNSPDERFRPTPAEKAISGSGEGKVYDGRLEIRSYNKGTIEHNDSIRDAVKAVLDGANLPLADSTHLFRITFMGGPSDVHDPALKADYHLMRFRVRFTDH